MPKAIIEPTFITGIHGNFQTAVDKSNKKRKKDDGADKTPFLTKNRKNKVRVMFRNKLEFVLCPLHESFTEKSSRTDGDYCLFGVISETRGISVDIYETEDPHFLVWFHQIKPGEKW